jgi:hypothetical protein
MANLFQLICDAIPPDAPVVGFCGTEAISKTFEVHKECFKDYLDIFDMNVRRKATYLFEDMVDTTVRGDVMTTPIAIGAAQHLRQSARRDPHRRRRDAPRRGGANPRRATTAGVLSRSSRGHPRDHWALPRHGPPHPAIVTARCRSNAASSSASASPRPIRELGRAATKKDGSLSRGLGQVVRRRFK